MPSFNILTAIVAPAVVFGAVYSTQASDAEVAGRPVPKVAQVALLNADQALAPIAAGPTSGFAPRPATVASSRDIDMEIADAVKAAKPAIDFKKIDIMSGVEQRIVEPAVVGNGRDRTVATLRNNSPSPIHVTIAAGQVLESGRNTVVVTRSAELEIMPAQSKEVRLSTVALYSVNKIGEGAYKLSYQTAPKVEGFLTWLADHPEVSITAAQTAVLALTENLPLNAFSKFAPTNGITSKLDTDAFRVDTSDLVSALSALRESGVNLETIALSLDPQLRIEAMIEPLSREAAKRYYGITEEREWDFWKSELLNGDPGTRHYALFGIARFYPQIAIEMLPKWARETKTHPVYRMAAIQALADTQRPEALPILHTLATELGATTELGKAAAQAAQYLDNRLSDTNRGMNAVAFRGKDSVSGF
ncbi:MAG: hypothetical protein RL088_2889 [Verrucomicrobiota bacterium]|jgi:hypothetical protein